MSSDGYEFEKGMGAKLKVQWTEFRGRRYLDLREWFEDENGEWHPTRKGCCLKPDLAREVVAAMLAVLDGGEQAFPAGEEIAELERSQRDGQEFGKGEER